MALKEYEKLKEYVILCLSKSQDFLILLNTLKDMFRNEINSQRRLEKISNIGDLIKILEKRAVLSSDNVKCLEVMINTLSSTSCHEALGFLATYKESHHQAYQVGTCYYGISDQNQITPPAVNSKPTNNWDISDRKRGHIYEVICNEIGKYWRDLARSLQVRENDIDDIDKKTTCVDEKAFKVLEKYEHKSDPQRWLYTLCEALEKSKRKDLSKIVQEIMLMKI